MKTKIAAILIASTILVSFGAPKIITKSVQPAKETKSTSKPVASIEPVGGFVLEDH